MTIHTNLRRGAVLLAVGGLGLGLVGVGARAAMTDSGSVSGSIKVGKLECTLTSTDPLAVISNGGHTVTINLPDILSSASSNAYSNFTVTNTGTMPELVHWTVAASGTIAFQPTGNMGYTVGPNGGGTNRLRSPEYPGSRRPSGRRTCTTLLELGFASTNWPINAPKAS